MQGDDFNLRNLFIAVVVDQASNMEHRELIVTMFALPGVVLFLKRVLLPREVVALLEPLLHHHRRHPSWQLTSIFQPLLLSLLSCLPSALNSVSDWSIQKHFTGLADSPSFHTLYPSSPL